MKKIVLFIIISFLVSIPLNVVLAEPAAQQSHALESASQQFQSYFLNKNIEKAKEGERSGSVSLAGRIPLTAALVGAGLYVGRDYRLQSGDHSNFTVSPSVRDRSGKLSFQSHDSFSEFKLSSQSRVGIGQNLPEMKAQTKVHYIPQIQDVRAIVSKNLTENLSVEAEKSVQTEFESVCLSYNMHF